MTPTCGSLYIKARDAAIPFAGRDPFLLFGAGFVVGQAEKVYSGACFSAMFRPEAQYHNGLRDIVRAIVPVYGLMWGMWEDEIWLFHKDSYRALSDTLKLEKNSPDWHRQRAVLCGIRDADIDVRFHERYGEAGLS